jgi:hypothetical protein
MNPEGKIDPALQKIENLLVEQCAHGVQSRDLLNPGAACGQFVGPTAKEKPQRGLHGTAAALRVLSQVNSPAGTELVQKLVWYVQNRERLYAEHKEPRQPDRTFEDDQQNVIKLSEVLYALSFVKASQSDKDALVHDLVTKLRNAQIEKKGWAYFLTGDQTIDPLPTAFAVLALCQHGYESEIGGQIEFLKEKALATGRDETRNINEASVRIFCIFALAFRKEEIAAPELKELRRAFIDIWEAHKAVLGLDIEQGIEYSKEANNYYLRIPWQLYLLALAARLDPKRISCLAAQRKLNHVLDAVQGNGFYYPYSGGPLSSRTNGILFDILQKIKRFNKRNLFHEIYYAYDAVRTFLGHRAFSVLTLIAGALVFVYCINAWRLKSGRAEDVGPDLSGAMIVMLITFAFERLRKPR